MKKHILILLIYFCSLPLHAKVIETSNFADILSEIDQNTLVFFDIDDTLITTTSTIGSTPFWSYSTKKLKEASLPSYSSRTNINEVILKILCRVPMKLVDPASAGIIKQLQQQKILTFALTARWLHADYSPQADLFAYNHLKSVDIDFSENPLSQQIQLPFFSYGILFTDYQEKGPFAKAFLEQTHLHPSKVVFIDDSPKQIRSVEKTMEEMHIPFVGFRYNKLDHIRFDPLIANIELEALVQKDQLLSDEEAKKVAEQKPRQDPDYFIDELIQCWTNSLTMTKSS